MLDLPRLRLLRELARRGVSSTRSRPEPHQIKHLWRSGRRSSASAPPDAADAPTSPVTGSAQEEESTSAAVRRRRRRRRMLIAAPLVVVLLWATGSYGVWMLQPTSMPWSVRSVEWVRQQV